MTYLVEAPKKQRGCLGKLFVFCVWILLVLVVLVVVVAIFSPKSSRGVQQPQAPMGKVPNPTATPLWVAPPYDAVCGSNSKVTEIQQEALVKSLIGKQIINWDGKVYNVSREGGAYTVGVDAEQGIFATQQVVLEGLPERPAASLNVGQQIVYSGTIQAISVAFGVICNPMTVVSVTLHTR